MFLVCRLVLIYSGNTRVGVICGRAPAGVDASFVRLNPGVTVSDIPLGLSSINRLQPVARAAVLNEFVAMRGARTGLPIRSSRITNPLTTFNGSGGVVTVATAGYASQGGDSGGIVFHIGTNQISGIHVGHLGGEAAFSRAAGNVNILAALTIALH